MLPSTLLERQHRQIDAGILCTLEGTGRHESLAVSLALLRRHIYLEEEILFPRLEAAGLAMPVFVMKREHAQMWPLYDQLVAACATEAPSERLQGLCASLYQLLQIHNPKEEQIVYAAADRLAEEGEAAFSEQALQSAQVPAEWACAMVVR